MRQAFSRQRLAWTAAGLAMVAAVAGCSSTGPTLPSGPAAIGTAASGAAATGFKTQQAWLAPSLGLGLLGPEISPMALGGLQWGRPYAAGYGYPLVLPQSSLWVGSGIELLTGTW
ncbi:MAG: hypothetical protein H7338_15545, partial [Candidatus Sericytochromatia bacterium]|nr:hypothetical protein [Candidatus Sericytochromatia bacterium]